jgi:hypothetical protein
MKKRRVFLTLELDTDAPLALLRDKSTWTFKDLRFGSAYFCVQAQANVAKQVPSGGVRYAREGERLLTDPPAIWRELRRCKKKGRRKS